jgi:hypothetical protein
MTDLNEMILARLDEQAQELRRIAEAQSRHGATLSALDQKVGIQNGRVAALERRELERRLDDARREGVREGRATVLVTRGQLAAIGTVAGAVSAVIAIAVKLSDLV